MTLEEKIQAVEQVFEKLDNEIYRFQGWSGLNCKWGCGKCCFKPDIEATILEFLPFAHALYHADQSFAWLEKLEQSDSSICLILNPTQAGAGLCTEYKHRGLICRLFGFSARTNKYDKKELVTCEIIKTEQADQYTKAYHKVEQEVESIPVMHHYYMQLHAIDYELTKDFYPINQAIRKAIETVLAYYAYRNS
ncbi:MAG TPA: YkgJ family cysteine cluster protein [Cyclobacteriaceae bacterium]|nr:YkgJ family cysteine cluster protein [Cyclobacteriaceae bacterium]HRJ81085.1 YkgJ family cysteine cluster protein [Cyclobacteriaceae bacterium]